MSAAHLRAGLTRGQLYCLHVIEELIAANGYSPTLDEIRVEMDLHSKSGPHRLVAALEERGWIRRLPHRARSIAILRDPPPLPALGIAGEPSEAA